MYGLFQSRSLIDYFLSKITHSEEKTGGKIEDSTNFYCCQGHYRHGSSIFRIKPVQEQLHADRSISNSNKFTYNIMHKT